jgi:hypothetical protein
MVLSVCGNVKGQETPFLALSATPLSASEINNTVYYISSTLARTDTGDFTVAYEFNADDMGANLNRSGATTVAFNGNAAQVSGAGADFAGRTLTIRKAGTYVLSGTLSNGQVLINAGRNDLVRLVLNGVTLHNETGPAIYAPRSEKVVLVLESGTVNTASDGSGYPVSGNGDEPNAAIYIQNNLSIAGSGTLAVTGSYAHGIRAQDVLSITGGVITINAVGDALRGRDGVAIRDGRFTLNAGCDGIQSNNANSDAMGFVIINGGTFDIKAKNDGIQAESSLTVTGGVFRITSGGGNANVPAPSSNLRGGWGRQVQMPITTVESDSMKALKAGKQVYIMGGDITIDAEDDGVHSNNNILISAGRLSIKTGDDGIHADNAVEITGGDIDISVSYEGIEGTSVTISGGNISVVARDDGINAADSSAGQAGRIMGGRSGGSPINENIFVRITGGTVNLRAASDGIDSNGNIFLEGGTVRISGPSQGVEGAIDLDGNMYVSGGELITAGSVRSVASSSTQPVILVAYTRQQTSGSVIAVKDSRGNTLIEYTSQNAYSMSGLTSPSFKIGETYTLFINDQKRTDIAIDNVITSIGDDGRVYSNNAGDMGGRGMGGRRW